MAAFMTKSLLTAVTGAVAVAAHAHIQNVVVSGLSYPGYNPVPQAPNAAVLAAWSAVAPDEGFVSPSGYATADINCHHDAKSGAGHIPVQAGSQMSFVWSKWPDTHKGAVLDYMASCGDLPCESVDKTKLKWFKIDALGLAGNGSWATDVLIKQNATWLVNIPKTLASGNYVIRHEILSLQNATVADGAQNYPWCFNLQVNGTGTDKPDGVLGTALYKTDEPGVKLATAVTATDLTAYMIPGPTLYSGAVAVTQSQLAVTASATAVVPTGATTASASTGSPTGSLTTSASTPIGTLTTSVSTPIGTLTTSVSSPIGAITTAPSTVVASSPATTATTATRRPCGRRRHARAVQAQ